MLVFRVWDWEVIAALGAAGHKEIRRETERDREREREYSLAKEREKRGEPGSPYRVTSL